MNSHDIFIPAIKNKQHKNRDSTESTTEPKTDDLEPLIGIELNSVSSFDTNRCCVYKTYKIWLASFIYVVMYAAFLVFVSFGITRDRKKHHKNTEYPYMFITSGLDLLVSIIPFIMSRYSITRKDILYNMFSGFMNSCFLAFLFFSSGTDQTNLTQQSILIGAGTIGYAIFSYVWSFKNLRSIETVFSMFLFLNGIGSAIYFLFKDRTYKGYMIMYISAHICHGVYESIAEHLWTKNKNKHPIHYFLSSLFCFIFVLIFSGFVVLNFEHRNYSEVWDKFNKLSVIGFIASAVFYPISNFFHHFINYDKKNNTMFIRLLIPATVYVVSLVLRQGKIEDIAVLSASFAVSIAFLILKFREIIKRHSFIYL